jgi:Flp pilus assembly protein TadG
MLVLFACVLPVLILFCGLALDVGMLQLKQLQMQSAADAAALGAELQWERTTNYTTAGYTAQAQADAAVNGFTN